MRYHGNYCGPNWSAGKAQASVVSLVPAIDEFDDTCRVHDAAYAVGSDLDAADRRFVADNLTNFDPKRWLAAAMVGGQLASRSIERLTTFHQPTPMNKRLRGASGQRAASEKMNTSRESPRNLTSVSAPAVRGTQIRGSGPHNVVKTSTNISMDVSVCVGRPSGATQAVVPEMLAVQYLMPVALGSDEVQNMTRVYQHYRITKATARYRPFQGTSAGGEVIMVSNDDPNYRPVNTASNSSFYQRALTSKHSVLTPIWCEANLPLAVDKGWKVCDNSNSTTIEEFCSGVLYFYADGTVATPGYIVVDLSIEFEGLRFNSRNLISGSYLGMGSRISTSVASTTANADGVIVGTAFSPGDVYAILLSTTGATFGAGLTASTMFVVSSGSGTLVYTLTGSTVLYGRASTSSAITLFTTYDAAIGGDASDKLLFGVTAATASTFPLTLVTQLRNSTQPLS